MLLTDNETMNILKPRLLLTNLQRVRAWLNIPEILELKIPGYNYGTLASTSSPNLPTHRVREQW